MADGPVRDPKELRALSHPFRWKLIQLLTEEGQATATRCSERLGESVASCSYHLNMLAKYGFVEEVAGPGRQKPWRLVRRDQSVSQDGLEFDEIENRLRQRDDQPEDWRRSLGSTSTVVFVTAEELDELRADIEAVCKRYESRHASPEARPVRLSLSMSVEPDK